MSKLKLSHEYMIGERKVFKQSTQIGGLDVFIYRGAKYNNQLLTMYLVDSKGNVVNEVDFSSMAHINMSFKE